MPDSGSSSITKSGVIEQADALRSVASGIKSNLDELDGKVNQLKSQWNGAAQVAYGEAQKQWTAKIEEMNQLLDRIGMKAKELAHQYGDQDDSSAKRFHRG